MHATLCAWQMFGKMNIKYPLTFWNQSTSGFLVLSFLSKFLTPQQKAATKSWVFLKKREVTDT